ncbi:helix-turn-helix transcriptional regulator [Paenibacillus herberti]|uniref:DNA-binding transcriptional regulator n=1 Tax=Paenibacillus herberti TaxID=1619309 RepID=A0A229P6M3_9BACL|nr:WYL domain-containing protein [Paenibacillus herberti]OXM17509.1 DNA-binding transcriptional regulator [Paenibacillus herberti]
MKRTDRLMAILIALQQRLETAQSLADKFEVSKRTILRDMQSLSEMGIPLYSMTGPTGGFRLMEGFQLPPLQLDSQEALTVLFALRAMTKMTDTPFNGARWTVTDKIKAILPEQTIHVIEPMLDYFEIEVPARTVKTPHLIVLLELTAQSRWIQALYSSENNQRWLQLLPRRIYTAHGFWYCEAYSVTHEEQRTFRVDRFETIEMMEPSDEVIEKVQQHDGQQQQHGNQDEALQRIRAKLTYRGALLAEQDFHIGEQVRQVSEEEWEVDFLCPASQWQWAIRFFFTLGLDAEVIEPSSLRQEIYSMSKELCDRYKL